MKIEDLHFHDLSQTGEVLLTLKGGREERFPLSPLAVEVIHRAKGKWKHGYVFINPKTGTCYISIHKSFNIAVRKLGLKATDGSKLRIHDLRHLTANWLSQAGISLDEIRVLLGHKDRATTDRYVTYDRNLSGQALTVIPKIRDDIKGKKMASTESESRPFERKMAQIGTL